MTQATDKSVTDSNGPEVELDESSLDAIRSILNQDTTPVASPAAAPQNVAVEKPSMPVAPVAPPRRKADALPDLSAPIDDPEAAARAHALLAAKPAKRWIAFPRRSAQAKPRVERKSVRSMPQPLTNIIARIKQRIHDYRFKPKHAVFAVFALLIVMKPWLVLGVLFLCLFVFLGVFLIVGYDRFWQGVMKANRWYANRRPARAAVLHARLDHFAMRWDAILDRFPEGTVDGLYLPDFGEMDQAEKRHDAALERRLAGLQNDGV